MAKVDKIFYQLANSIVKDDRDMPEKYELCHACKNGEHISCNDEEEDASDGVIYICTCGRCHGQ